MEKIAIFSLKIMITVEEVMWLLRLKKPKKWQKIHKKIASCMKKLLKFVIINVEN